MTPFLKQVAAHYCCAEYNFERLLFVFPSRRAEAFFYKYVGELVKDVLKKPLKAPQVCSIDDFFSSMSQLVLQDKLSLMLKLYDAHCACCKENGKLTPEPLDEFVYWADVLLSDFADVDKYLANAKDLFRNVAQYKAMGDDFSDITDPHQKAALEHFMGHFKVDGKIKTKFFTFWDLLYPLYEKFNDLLAQAGECYDGSQIRSIVADIESRGAQTVFAEAFPDCDKVIFCGLNALDEAEKKILTAFKRLGLSEFCWDYESEWIKDNENRSSFFMKQNVLDFPQTWKLETLDAEPEFEIISVPSASGQAKLLNTLLNDPQIPADEHTAVVLPDENLLESVLNSIPERVGKINVTMGSAMSASSFYALMEEIAQLQLTLRLKDGKAQFYHKPVWNIVSNNIFALLTSSSENVASTLDTVRQQRRYYVDSDAMQVEGLMSLIFKPVMQDKNSTESAQLSAIQDYQLAILNHIGRAIASDEQLKSALAFELDYAMEYVKAVNLLKDKTLDEKYPLAVTPSTYFNLLSSVLSSKSVPFKGEPLQGLQIMGPLELRALDFDKLIIMSSNEASFPRKSLSSSFIPPLMRKGFGLPTYEYQDAVWAYYFYRMVQRPSKVWMILDSRTEGLTSGEESRYIKQLEYCYGAKLSRFSASAMLSATSQQNGVTKLPEHIDKIRGMEHSPTSLQYYLDCPAKFFYAYIEKIRAVEDIEDNLDAAMIGRCFHQVMEKLYSNLPGRIQTQENLKALRADRNMIRALVAKEIEQQLGTNEIKGRNLVYANMLCKYVEAALKRDIDFLDTSPSHQFKVIRIEKSLKSDFNGFKLKGTVDRIDSCCSGEVRLVDYKTGKVLKDDVNITDSTAVKIAAKIFDKNTSASYRPKIALQFFVYDYLIHNDKELSRECAGKDLVNLVYSTRLLLNESPVPVAENKTFYDEMVLQLKALFVEMSDPAVNFDRRKNDMVCSFCDYKTICSR